MASELAEGTARLQQAPDVSGQMARLDQMMSVDNNNNYWVGRQPTQSPFADFRGIGTPPPQTGRTLTDADIQAALRDISPVQTQPMPDLTQPLLEPTGQGANQPYSTQLAYNTPQTKAPPAQQHGYSGTDYAIFFMIALAIVVAFYFIFKGIRAAFKQPFGKFTAIIPTLLIGVIPFYAIYSAFAGLANGFFYVNPAIQITIYIIGLLLAVRYMKMCYLVLTEDKEEEEDSWDTTPEGLTATEQDFYKRAFALVNMALSLCPLARREIIKKLGMNKRARGYVHGLFLGELIRMGLDIGSNPMDADRKMKIIGVAYLKTFGNSAGKNILIMTMNEMGRKDWEYQEGCEAALRDLQERFALGQPAFTLPEMLVTTT